MKTKRHIYNFIVIIFLAFVSVSMSSTQVFATSKATKATKTTKKTTKTTKKTTVTKKGKTTTKVTVTKKVTYTVKKTTVIKKFVNSRKNYVIQEAFKPLRGTRYSPNLKTFRNFPHGFNETTAANYVNQQLNARNTKITFYSKVRLSDKFNDKIDDYTKYSWASFVTYYSDKPDANGEYYNYIQVTNYLTAKEEQQVTKNIKTFKGTDAQKVKAIHDYLCKINTYATNSKDARKFTAYGALVQKKSVCQGYSLAFYRMAKASGLQVKIVSGKAYNGKVWEQHAWNQVRVNGVWKYMDVTWDDGSVISYNLF